MATHTISIAAPAEDEAAAADAIELHCAADGSPLRIAAASGGTWHVVARNAATFTRLAHEAMRCPAVERVPGFGGLLSATSVLENIVLPQQIGPDTADVVRDDPFRSAFLRLKEGRGLYIEKPGAINFQTSILYSATIPIPAGVPTGTYNTELKLFADGALIASSNEAFDIVKFGFEQFVAESALKHGLLYGLASASMAVLTGWLAAVMFRRD